MLFCSFRGIHDCLVPVTPYVAGIFKHLRTKSKLPPRVRAVDMRHVLLILPFLLDGLLTEEVEEHNRRNPVAQIVDPSPMMVNITIMLLSWYQLYRRKFPAKDEEDIKDLGTLGKRLSVYIFYIYAIILHIFSDITPMCSVFRFLRKCVELFPYKNKRGDLIIATEKMHSIKHAQHDIIRWADPENTSCDGPETNHKKWIKGQGGKTNQSETSNKTMMNHSLRKEASALLCEAIQGDVHI